MNPTANARAGALPAILAALLLLTAPAARALPAAGSDALPLSPCRVSDALGVQSYAARCGRLRRPENPADPDGRQLELFVAVVPALSPTPASDAFTAIAGGPGAASTQFYASYAAAFGDVRRERDIVLVDQRGTGRSNRLDCTMPDAQMGTPSPAEVRELTRECLAGLDGDPRFYTTSVAVEDLDAVREALGYEQLVVYGASYGTRVALHYLRRYPEHARAVILDGVAPAQVPLTPEIALDAQTALDALFERCADDEACREAFPTLPAQFDALRQRLREQAALVILADPFTGEPRRLALTDDHLRIAVRLLSYDTYSMSVLPQVISRAYEKDYVPLAAQAVMVMDSFDKALAYGMHNAVICTEDAPYFDVFLDDTGRDALADTYLGLDQLETMEQACAVWPRGVIDEAFKTPVVSDRPVLVLSGSADPVTPPRNGERAIGEDGAYLRNARHIVVPGQGHGVAAVGCLPRIVGEFVASAAVTNLDTDCVDRIGPAAFFVDYTGPKP